MTIRVAHFKVSNVPDGDNAGAVRPSDWNADHVIEGLGTAAEADSSDFATAAQGALADTAVQPAAIANMLETDDIGVTVQAWNTNLDDWSGVNPVGYYTALQIDAGFQPLDADLASWASVTRASGFDTFAATPSSANLRSLLTDEDGTGPALFGGSSYIREKLTANRTYYVRSDGGDSNDGLTDSSGGAFLTIAKAIATALTLDPSIYSVTVMLQDGTWTTGPSMSTAMIGNKTVTIAGSGSANVTIAGTTGVSATGNGVSLTITGVTIAATGTGIIASVGGTINIGADVVFAGSPSSAHIRTNGPGSQIQVNANYSITSGGARHYQVSPGGFINAFARTITLTGTLNFSTAFAQADRGALLSTNASTFTGGTVTGKRYDATTNAVIFTGGAGANHYPGDVAGTTATGGQYA